MLKDALGNTYHLLDKLAESPDFISWKAEKTMRGGQEGKSLVILKRLRQGSIDPHVFEVINRRFYIQHHNIVQQRDVFLSDSPVTFCSTSCSPYGFNMCVVEEYLESCSLRTLAHYLESSSIRPLTNAQLCSLLHEICTGIKFLHQDMRMAHRSLSLSKILLDLQKSKAKISFLEKADDHNDDDYLSYRELKDQRCSQNVDQNPIDPIEKAQGNDIWSLALMAVELVVANSGRGKEAMHQLVSDLSVLSCSVDTSVISTSYASSIARNYSISSELVNFMCCCFRKEPSVRPTIGKLLEHRLFSPSSGGVHDPQIRRKHMEFITSTCIKQCSEDGEKFCDLGESGRLKESGDEPNEMHILDDDDEEETRFNWWQPPVKMNTDSSPASPVDTSEGQTSATFTSGEHLRPEDSGRFLVEEATRATKQFLNDLQHAAETNSSLSHLMEGSNVSKEQILALEKLKENATASNALLADLDKCFTAIANSKPSCIPSFSNAFATQVLRKTDRAVRMAALVALSRKLHQHVATPPPTDAATATTGAPHQFLDEMVMGSRWEKVPSMPLPAAAGSVNVPHYLFNKWLKKKESFD